MNKVTEILNLIDSYIGGAQWFVFLLLGTGLFFTLYLKFPQIRYFKHSVHVLLGRYDQSHHQGDTSHFQALSTALSGTVGTGNIAGVALAIHLGGPAALFWMLVTAFFGMTTKMVEVTLSHKYRERTSKGFISGGPMYYMRNRLNMKWLAAIFAIATICSSLGTGSLPQINSISNSMFSVFGIKHHITGAVLALILGLIIIGGIKRIAKVSEKLVPFMAVIYIIGALSVLIYNYQNLLPSFLSIFTDVFTGTAAAGGFLGAGFMLAFNRGVNRGLFSNEAGQGSAPIAHAAAKTDEPVSEGMVAILEPFLDTIVICFMTGMVLISSGVWTQKYDNRFQQADMIVLSGEYDENNDTHRRQIAGYLGGKETLPLYSGVLDVENGRVVEGDFTILHARSFAEDVSVKVKGKPYTGVIPVNSGNVELVSDSGEILQVTGKSLIHSAPLSTEAFKQGLLGDFGQYIIPFALLLFAFTTAVAWSYYGDRAIIYLWGEKWVRPYHIIYVLGFFFASFVDTSIVWAFSGVTVAFMTLPNLIGILLLRKEMKSMLNDYDVKVLKKRNKKSQDV